MPCAVFPTPRLLSINLHLRTELYNDEGERVPGPALGIANALWDGEESARLGDALCELVGELRQQ